MNECRNRGCGCIICPDSHPALTLQRSCVNGYGNVKVDVRWNVQVGENVDAQSVQETLTEMTAVCESWWGEASAIVLNECMLPSTQNRYQYRQATHTHTHTNTSSAVALAEI